MAPYGLRRERKFIHPKLLAADFEKIAFEHLEIRENPTYPADFLEIVEKGTNTKKNLWVSQLRASSFVAGSSGAFFYTQQAGAGSFLKWAARKTGAPASWVNCARLFNSLTAPYLDIPKAGSLIPIAAKTLGGPSNLWSEAYITAILAHSLDLYYATHPIIYMAHNGAGQEGSVEYDKTNHRWLFKCSDGAGVIGYIDNAGFNNGAP